MSTANGETDAPKGNGSNPLHSAVLARDVVRVRTLINQGRPVNEQDGAGNTPLHLAAGKGLIGIVQAFKEARADPNITNVDGITPWQTAVLEGHAQVAKRLVEMGAHRNHRFVDESCQLCAVYEDQQSVATDCQGVIRRVRPTTPEGVRRLSIVVGGAIAAVWSIYIIVRAIWEAGWGTEMYPYAWVLLMGAGVGYFGGIVVVRGIARIIRWTIEGFKTTPSKPSGASPPREAEVMRMLNPPSDQTNADAWDQYWNAQLAVGVPSLIDMLYDDRRLVEVMMKEGLRTVLCAGNGISMEPRALASAGFQVIALDISPLALQIAPEVWHGDEHLDHLVGPESMRQGGGVEYVVGNVLDVAICPGPFDVIIERRTAQNYPDETRGAFLTALVDRLSADGIFVSHCHDGSWRPGAEPRHATREWFGDSGWPIWNGPPDDKPPGRVAWLVTSTG